MKASYRITGGRIDIPMVLRRITGGGNSGLRDAAMALKEESDRRTPFDTGRLVGTSELYQDDAAMVTVVSYATPYATILHESPQLNFQSGKEGKWLQNAADRVAGDGQIEVKIGRGLSEALS